MGPLLLRVFPLALGAAASPTLLALEILALSGPRKPVARGWAVAGGAAVMLVLFALLGLTVVHSVTTHRGYSPVDGAVDLGAAAVLALLATRTLRRRPTAAEGHQKTMANRLADAPTVWFFGAGVVGMLLNFSTLVLFIPALHLISRSSVHLGDKVMVGVVLVTITLLPVLIPALLVTVLGRRADVPLARLNRFVGGHSRQITAAIEILFSVVLLIKGLGELR